MKPAEILKKACLTGIGAIEFSRDKLFGIRESLGELLDDFEERGERLSEKEDSLARALLAALRVRSRIPSTAEANGIIPDYDDLTVTEIVDQIKRLPMKQLETIRTYEYHNFNRIRVLRQIDKELDEVRIIPDYDDLPVSAVVERLDDLSPQELAAIKEYEKSHRNRATIIKAIGRRLKEAA